MSFFLINSRGEFYLPGAAGEPGQTTREQRLAWEMRWRSSAEEIQQEEVWKHDFRWDIVPAGEVAAYLANAAASALGCERDTDGDGDCDQCAADGGCVKRRAAFAAAVRNVVGENSVPLVRIYAGREDGPAVLPPIEFNPDSLSMLKRTRADLSPLRSATASPALSERAELRAWRLFGADVMPLLERALWAYGETPDPAILSLQHSLAELLRSPANTHGAQ